MFAYRIRDRLELRLLGYGDAEELFALIDTNRGYLREWLPWLDATTTLADVQGFIRRALQQLADNQGFVGAICLDGPIVGLIGYRDIVWHHRVGSLWYWLDPTHQGQGIMTAACGAVVEHAFTALELNRVVIACATGNTRSRAIPERLGFTLEGTLRQAEWLYDHFVDHALYALLRRDWPAKSSSS